MVIGVLSDTHNNVENLKMALEVFYREGVATLIHCGDLGKPDMAAHLNGFQVIYLTSSLTPANDPACTAIMALNPNNQVSSSYAGEIGGKRVAATQGNIFGSIDELIRLGRYDYVFHGKTHRRRDQTIGNTRVINPGALGGVQMETRSVCLINLETGEARFIEFPDAE